MLHALTQEFPTTACVAIAGLRLHCCAVSTQYADVRTPVRCTLS